MPPLASTGTPRSPLAPAASGSPRSLRAEAPGPATRAASPSMRRCRPPRRPAVVSASCPAGFSSPPPEDEKQTPRADEEEERRLASLPRLTGSRRRLMPLVGETPLFVRDHLGFAIDRAREHGPVFRTSLYGIRNVAFVTDFPSIERVFQGEHVTTEWYQPGSFQRLLGSASSAETMASRERHSRQRRQQARAFSPAALASYAPRVAAATEAAVASWSDAGAVDLGAALSDLTWQYALATVVDLDLDEAEKRAVRESWDEFSGNLYCAEIDVPGSRFRRALRARERLSEALLRSVRDYKSSFESEERGGGAGAKPPTMLSYYMRARSDDGDPITDEDELVSMAIGLLLAGYETSHSAHFLLLYVLASPQFPRRVRDALEREQRDVVERHGQELTADALADMPVAEACSKWCLWALGPADGIFRRALADFELGGRRVERGTVIYSSFLAAKATDERVVPGGIAGVTEVPPPHMDVNDLARSFAPERFLRGFAGESDAVSTLLDSSPSGSTAAAEPTSLATFGFGAHYCLGAPLYALEAKALVATLVRAYDLSLAPTGDGEPPMRFATSWAATSRSGQAVKVVVKRKREAAEEPRTTASAAEEPRTTASAAESR